MRRPLGIGVSCLATVHHIRRLCHECLIIIIIIIISSFVRRSCMISLLGYFFLSCFVSVERLALLWFGWGCTSVILAGVFAGSRLSRFEFQVMALCTFLPYWPAKWSCVYHALVVQQKKIGTAWHGVGQLDWAAKAGSGL